MRRAAIALAALGALAWTDVLAQTATGEAPAAGATAPAGTTPAEDPAKRAEGLAAWDKIHRVLSHPRCVNCHVPDDNLPRWSGTSYGTPRPHGMDISGGDSRIGVEYLPCASCHGVRNVDRPHGPPGAPHWRLAPVEQVWWDRAPSRICDQLKDPERNGGRTLAEIADHVANDELVAWGWSPGPGREPAPFSPGEAADLIRTWDATGAPCPE